MKSIKTALKQIRRTPYQAFAATAILSITFFAVAVFILISSGFHVILKYFESTPQVIAFFEKGQDLSNEQLQQIKDKLEKTGKLASFKYVSTKDAEAIYKEKNADDPLLNELVDYKILPPSVEISATELNSLPALKDILEAEPLVTDISFYEEVVKNISNWLINIRYLGLGMVVFLLFLSILILIVMISLKIKNKRTEIEILRLLGASTWYILSPFLVEGMIYGAAGAFFGWIAAFTLLQYSTPFLLQFVADIITLPLDFQLLLIFLGVLMLGGMIVGAFSSLIAVKRFVRI